ncbi:Thoeris anti-defense Tad2 family protein [Bordetella sp.]|uniref:Thoeris anti-defense Tad2 family protein n=1 Tax=Bordetella sp. TaxID=28081 RepID=UPI0039C85615
MDFESTIPELKQPHHTVRRTSWPDGVRVGICFDWNGRLCNLSKTPDFVLQPFLYIVRPTGSTSFSIEPWLPTGIDLMATDWEFHAAETDSLVSPSYVPQKPEVATE